ncbi:hypothetical protein CCAX7_47790 [Capsulimonas corticalis]|uniref:DUF5658 domain-containing protein n=1 Tax=Capsulimonas corticalis TaxID=2219043 RepID=A0A402CQE1_9BACT|nr:DUF5658 family protein [Capsulimonas corticalis]BDI32728.1 hypothetical protein CCAX7_47790 [Capsulimonas corticalis]
MFFKKDVLLAQEYLGFLLLNMFDLFLTGLIFRLHGDEANGIAVFIMEHYGLAGFAIYKFLLVLVVVLACEGISLSSIRKSRIIITAGCLVYLMVVFWECFLVTTHLYPKPAEPEEISSSANAAPNNGVDPRWANALAPHKRGDKVRRNPGNPGNAPQGPGQNVNPVVGGDKGNQNVPRPSGNL